MTAEPIVAGRAQRVITEAELASLPGTARRYLRFMQVVGRPRDNSFQIRWRGRFRKSPFGRWMNCDAWQRNTSPEISRTFRMRIRLGPLTWVTAHDTYCHGHGRMRGRLLDLIPVVDATGPELDIGELVTWLNDAVLLSPSMLLRPEVVWTPVDELSFDLALTDAQRTVTARVFVGPNGAPRVFSTTDRFVEDPYVPEHPWFRARWTTPVDGWQLVQGRMRPTRASAVWHLARGDFAYADVDFSSARLTFGDTRLD